MAEQMSEEQRPQGARRDEAVRAAQRLPPASVLHALWQLSLYPEAERFAHRGAEAKTRRSRSERPRGRMESVGQ